MSRRANYYFFGKSIDLVDIWEILLLKNTFWVHMKYLPRICVIFRVIQCPWKAIFYKLGSLVWMHQRTEWVVWNESSLVNFDSFSYISLFFFSLQALCSHWEALGWTLKKLEIKKRWSVYNWVMFSYGLTVWTHSLAPYLVYSSIQWRLTWHLLCTRYISVSPADQGTSL